MEEAVGGQGALQLWLRSAWASLNREAQILLDLTSHAFAINGRAAAGGLCTSWAWLG